MKHPVKKKVRKRTAAAGTAGQTPGQRIKNARRIASARSKDTRIRQARRGSGRG